MIIRSLYHTLFMNASKQPMIIVLTWQRRVWKSVLLHQFSEKYSHSWICDMEEYENQILTDLDFFYQTIKERIERDSLEFIWIDEIQWVQWREKVILWIKKKFPNVIIVVTWSNSYLLASEFTTLLRGRYTQIHVYPFWLEEFALYHNQPVNKAVCDEYVCAWWFSYAYWLQTDDEKKQRVEGLINTIFLRDVIERFRVRNPVLLRELFLYIVDTAGSLTNMQNIKNALKQRQIFVTIDTLQEYMHYLATSYLIYPVDVMSIHWKKIFERIRKWYPADHSRRALLLWWSDAWMGKMIETIVYFTLLRQWFTVVVGQDKEKECDFIATRHTKKLSIQVTYMLATPEVIAREYEILKLIPDNYPKCVVSYDTLVFWSQEWIEHVQLRNFPDRLKKQFW